MALFRRLFQPLTAQKLHLLVFELLQLFFLFGDRLFHLVKVFARRSLCTLFCALFLFGTFLDLVFSVDFGVPGDHGAAALKILARISVEHRGGSFLFDQAVGRFLVIDVRVVQATD